VYRSDVWLLLTFSRLPSRFALTVQCFHKSIITVAIIATISHLGIFTTCLESDRGTMAQLVARGTRYRSPVVTTVWRPYLPIVSQLGASCCLLTLNCLGGDWPSFAFILTLLSNDCGLSAVSNKRILSLLLSDVNKLFPYKPIIFTS
jgi:hypothetical protein